MFGLRFWNSEQPLPLPLSRLSKNNCLDVNGTRVKRVKNCFMGKGYHPGSDVGVAGDGRKSGDCRDGIQCSTSWPFLSSTRLAPRPKVEVLTPPSHSLLDLPRFICVLCNGGCAL